jgi:hypothetical protein
VWIDPIYFFRGVRRRSLSLAVERSSTSTRHTWLHAPHSNDRAAYPARTIISARTHPT